MSEHDRGKCEACEETAEMMRPWLEEIERQLREGHPEKDVQAELRNRLRTAMFLMDEVLDYSLEKMQLPVTIVVDVFGREISKRLGLNFSITSDAGAPVVAFGPRGVIKH